ncbi:MAG: hypothetical protein OQK12_16100, partial [Motiliproteus sp.]|nr:hypothetical protein [Motiliproteus sp.]
LRGLLDEPAPAKMDVDDVDSVVLKLNELVSDEDTRDSFIDSFENLASSIWDGVKRIAKMVWRVISGLVSKVNNLARNLARFVARESRQYFHIVVRAVDVVQGGVDYLRNSIFPQRLPAPVVIAYGADFDHQLFIEKATAKPMESAAYITYRQLAFCYQAGCMVMGELIGLLARVVKLASGPLAGPLGWLRALLALGRFRSSLKQVDGALKMLEKNYKVSGNVSAAVMQIDVA